MSNRKSATDHDGVPYSQLAQAVASGSTVYSTPFSLELGFDVSTHVEWSRVEYDDNYTLTPDTHRLSFVSSSMGSHATALVATTGALGACTAGGAGAGKTLTADTNGVLQIDTITGPASGSIVLVKDQVQHLDNGVYGVNTSGTVGAPFVLIRYPGYDASVRSGTTFLVTTGSTNGSRKFSVTGPLVTGSVVFETSNVHNPRLHTNDSTAKFTQVSTGSIGPAGDQTFLIHDELGLAGRWYRAKLQTGGTAGGNPTAQPAGAASRVVVSSFSKGK